MNAKLTLEAKELLVFPCSPYTMESDIHMLESTLTCEEIVKINELASMHWTPRDNFYGVLRPLVNMRGIYLKSCGKTSFFLRKGKYAFRSRMRSTGPCIWLRRDQRIESTCY